MTEEESNMKTVFRNPMFFVVLASAVLYLSGCKASEKLEQEEMETPPEEAVVNGDTPEVKVVPLPRTETESAPAPSTAAPTMVYAVQIGAFEYPDNALRIEQQAKARFTQPVRRVFDNGTKLYKVSVGSFPLKDQALEFRKTIQQRYPGEYTDAWIVEVPK